MITILCVGKLKEKSLYQLCGEYIKRLSRYVAVTVTELPDLPEPRNITEDSLERMRLEEGRAVLRRIRQRDYVIALCVEGGRIDSQAFADRLEALKQAGRSDITFLIGGSAGLSTEVKARADAALSLSALTFPHGLARLVLLEQLYRAHKIIAGERYHK